MTNVLTTSCVVSELGWRLHHSCTQKQWNTWRKQRIARLCSNEKLFQRENNLQTFWKTSGQIPNNHSSILPFSGVTCWLSNPLWLSMAVSRTVQDLAPSDQFRRRTAKIAQLPCDLGISRNNQTQISVGGTVSPTAQKKTFRDCISSQAVSSLPFYTSFFSGGARAACTNLR